MPAPEDGRDGSDAVRRLRIRQYWLLAILGVLAALVRWQLADLEVWGEDEAGNLWLASDILAGRVHTLGLMSSRGVRNLAGAPLLAVPFTWLPDLLSISRAVAFVHLAAALPLAVVLGRTATERALVAGLLWFYPVSLLIAFGFWNQYLTAPITMVVLALLIWLAEGDGGGRTRAAAVVATAALAVGQAMVHLVHVVDLGVTLALLAAIIAGLGAPLDRRLTRAALTVVALVAMATFAPWIADTAMRGGRRVLLLAGVAAGAPAVAAALVTLNARQHARGRAAVPIARAPAWLSVAPAASRLRRWAIPALLAACLVVGVVPSLWGAQIAHRMLQAGAPIGYVLFAAQLVVGAALAAVLWRILPRRASLRTGDAGQGDRDALTAAFGGRADAAKVLVAYAGLLAIGRLLLSVSPLPAGRMDLWASIVPALLAPLVLLAQTTAQLRPALGAAVVATVGASTLLAVCGPGDRYRAAQPHAVSPSEMRTAVDLVAARHRAHGGGDTIDVSYEMPPEKAWIPSVTRDPEFRWYSLGRPYDWLLRRRHRLRNAHEGAVDRTNGRGFQLGFRHSPPPAEWRVVAELDRLAVREWHGPRRGVSETRGSSE